MSISDAMTRPNPAKSSMALRWTAVLEVFGKLGLIPPRCIPVRSRMEANAAAALRRAPNLTAERMMLGRAWS